MSEEDDVRFYIAKKLITSDKPLELINVIKKVINEFECMFKDREKIKRDINGFKRKWTNRRDSR